MLAIQRVSPGDNFDSARKSMRKKRLKHLVTRSAHREVLLSKVLLSKLMRAFEILVALFSPVFSWPGASVPGVRSRKTGVRRKPRHG